MSFFLQEETTDEYSESLFGKGKSLKEKVTEAITEATAGATELNKVFGQTNQRISEIQTGLSEVAPRLTRLGTEGMKSMDLAISAIKSISQGLERNIIASSEGIEKLYATSKVVNVEMSTLVSYFRDVGIGFNQIGPQLEESVKYVQNLGLNTQQVMSQVVNNVDKLNRYNFSDGVQGLTKMAAKAAMFKADMGETFRLADSVMNPENAINIASTFQRLGVAAGTLVDPFALMNASINDPGALQDGLVNVSKQFTYFDEKTKSFKINPQGIMTLKQMEQEAGLASGSLTKMGLAAAEVDARLSQISPSIRFKDESDKQFLSNLAEMNAQGEYTVKIKDAEGKEQTKKLSEVTQQEFDNLIEQQKKSPKTMEDIARAQLTVSEEIKTAILATKEAPIRGIANTQFIKENVEDFRKLTSSTLGPISDELAKTQIFGKQFDTATNAIRDAAQSLISSKGQSFGTVMSDLSNKFGKQGEDIQKVVAKLSTNIYEKIKEKGGNFGQSEIGKLSQYAVSELKDFESKYTKLSSVVAQSKSPSGAEVSTSPSILYGTQRGSLSATGANTQNINQSVDYSGTITIKVDAPAGVSTQYLTDFVNSEKFKEMIYNFIKQKDKELGKTK